MSAQLSKGIPTTDYGGSPSRNKRLSTSKNKGGREEIYYREERDERGERERARELEDKGVRTVSEGYFRGDISQGLEEGSYLRVQQRELELDIESRQRKRQETLSSPILEQRRSGLKGSPRLGLGLGLELC
jgi:hypothetical protein